MSAQALRIAMVSRSVVSSYALATEKPAQRRHWLPCMSAEVRAWKGVVLSVSIGAGRNVPRNQGGMGCRRGARRLLPKIRRQEGGAEGAARASLGGGGVDRAGMSG